RLTSLKGCWIGKASSTPSIALKVSMCSLLSPWPMAAMTVRSSPLMTCGMKPNSRTRSQTWLICSSVAFNCLEIIIKLSPCVNRNSESFRCFRVTTQNFDARGKLGQMRQRVAHSGFRRVADEIQVEAVFPRAAHQRTRFDLRQVNVAQGEDGHRAVKRPGAVFEREDNGSLIGLGWRHLTFIIAGGREQQEAREVLLVVFDLGDQQLRPVNLSRRGARNRGGPGFAAFHNHLDAARRVVGGDGQHLRVGGEELLALAERHLMRVDAAHVFKLRSGRDDQVVNDAEVDLAPDPQVVFEQQVVVLKDRAEQRILNRREAVIGLAALDRREHPLEAFAGHEGDRVAEQLARRLGAERAHFALKGYPWLWRI